MAKGNTGFGAVFDAIYSHDMEHIMNMAERHGVGQKEAKGGLKGLAACAIAHALIDEHGADIALSIATTESSYRGAANG